MFDWKLYQDNQLIEEYLNLNIIDNIYKVNDNLHYDYQHKKIVRDNDDYSFVIDLNNNEIFIKLNSHNYEGNIPLYKSNITDTKEELVIMYQVSEEEPLNKIIISRRNAWKSN